MSPKKLLTSPLPPSNLPIFVTPLSNQASGFTPPYALMASFTPLILIIVFQIPIDRM